HALPQPALVAKRVDAALLGDARTGQHDDARRHEILVHGPHLSAVLGSATMAIGVLFVCTGNICRSPMAAGVFRTLIRKAGMANTSGIDSAGTSAGHVGSPAALLAVEAAARRGYDISSHRARLVTNADLEKFDLPLAMDRTHLAALRWLASRERQDRPTLLM